MDEYIKREAVVKLLRGVCVGKYPSTFCVGLFAAADEIGKIPAADVVEVVRCRDCFYSANGNCTKGEQYDDTRYRPDYFCADGYRKDGE